MQAKYEKQSLLGSGNFGQAWLVKSVKSQRLYVLKEMKMTPNLTAKERERTFTEVSIIKSCCHVNIIRYKDFFISASDEEISSSSKPVPIICIVMEYADDGDLDKCIRRHREVKKVYFAEAQIRNWLVQIAFALQYLHKNKILHRDLKTHNIFMTSTRLLKVGDFGISRTLSNDNDFATTGIGTPQNLSPEICRQQGYDYKSDIWGLGCVLYEMCALRPAFVGNDLPQMLQNIIRASYRPIPQQYSSSISELIKVMLRPDPGRRPTAAQILGAKVLHQDVLAYMEYIQSLPDVLSSQTNSSESGSEGRKGSSSSVGSADVASSSMALAAAAAEASIAVPIE